MMVRHNAVLEGGWRRVWRGASGRARVEEARERKTGTEWVGVRIVS